MWGHITVLQSCLPWRQHGGWWWWGCTVGVSVWAEVGGCRWWMTSPLRETFPQPAHKEGRQKVKRMRKNRNLTVCKKGGKVWKCLLMGKRLFQRGSHLPFSDSQIFRDDRSATSAQKSPRKTALTVTALSLAQFGSCRLSAESPAAILSLSWTFTCTSCCTSCQAAHQHLVAKRFSQPPPPLDDITFLALLTPNGVWKSKGRLPFGNASLTESLSASDPRPPLTLFELAI